MYDLKDNTTVVVEPLTLSEIKTYLRIPTANTSDDTYLTALITSGREKFEQTAWRSVVPKIYTLIIDSEEPDIYLPYPPIDSITSVEYWDGEKWTALDSSDDYFVFGERNKILNVPYYYNSRLRIEFTTLGDDNSVFLELIKQWIGSVYDNRPDSDEVEEKVVKRMAKLRVNT